MPVFIDPKSVASLCLVPYAFSADVGRGTGFIVTVGGIHLLITNYHVLSGRHPDTGEQMRGVQSIPDRVLIPLLRRNSASLSWYPHVQHTLIDGIPAWIEHPRLGRHFDVVALPLNIPQAASPTHYERDPGPPLALHLGSELMIIGFPEGMVDSNLTAIWKAGTIASEPALSISENDFFWIDSNTRPGMSGSPVVARRFGGALMEDGNYNLSTGVVDLLLGVYAGRALDARDMTLGRVWSWSGVQEIIDVAISKVRRGIAPAIPCRIGHFGQPGVAMIRIEISMLQRVIPAQGQGAPQNFTLEAFMLDFVLGDQRFGINLARVRMAAAIAAAIEHASAQADAENQFPVFAELTEEQYALVRETVENPSNPYNPIVARQLLPFIDHLLAAGTPVAVPAAPAAAPAVPVIAPAPNTP